MIADVRVYRQHSMVGFLALTVRARGWFNENVRAERRQYSGLVLYVNSQHAGDFIARLEAEGFTVEEQVAS